MSPREWKQVNDIFLAAARLDPGERQSFLDRVCSGKPELLAEVAKLLAGDKAFTTEELTPAPFRLQPPSLDAAGLIHRKAQGQEAPSSVGDGDPTGTSTSEGGSGIRPQDSLAIPRTIGINLESARPRLTSVIRAGVPPEGQWVPTSQSSSNLDPFGARPAAREGRAMGGRGLVEADRGVRAKGCGSSAAGDAGPKDRVTQPSHGGLDLLAKFGLPATHEDYVWQTIRQSWLLSVLIGTPVIALAVTLDRMVLPYSYVPYILRLTSVLGLLFLTRIVLGFKSRPAAGVYNLLTVSMWVACVAPMVYLLRFSPIYAVGLEQALFAFAIFWPIEFRLYCFITTPTVLICCAILLGLFGRSYPLTFGPDGSGIHFYTLGFGWSLACMSNLVFGRCRGRLFDQQRQTEVLTRTLSHVGPAVEVGALLADRVCCAVLDRLAAARPLDEQELIQELVADGSLHEYQAAMILEGRARALRLGNFLIISPLGQGGMGRVWKVRRPGDGTVFALKEIYAGGKPPTREQYDRLFLEFEIGRRLRHPNIVKIEELVQDESRLLLVMEYLEGTSLRDILEERGPFPPDLAADIVLQTASGLGCLHDNDIIHRDVKLSNLFMTNGRRVVLLDLGLARLQEQGQTITVNGGFGGTFDYTSPEQIRDFHRADPRSDLYSLGCCWYELVVGHPPFAHCPGPAKLQAHVALVPEEPIRLVPRLPAEHNDIILRLLCKDPGGRYVSASELISVLHRRACRRKEGTS